MSVRYSQDRHRGSLGFAVFTGASSALLGVLAGLIVLSGRAPTEQADLLEDRVFRFDQGHAVFRMGSTRGGYPQTPELAEAFTEGRGERTLALSEPDLNLLARAWLDFTPQVTASIDQLLEQGARSYLVPETPNFSLSENLLLISTTARFKPPYRPDREVRLSIIVTTDASDQAQVEALYLNSARIPVPLRSYFLNRLRSQLLTEAPPSQILTMLERADTVVISGQNLHLTQ